MGRGDMKYLEKNYGFYVLALSHKHITLYEGDQYGLNVVPVKGLDVDMKKMLGIDEYPNWRETHTIAPASRGKGSEAYHGQYNVHQTDKIMLKDYFRRIDKKIHAYLLGKHKPLILAGVGYLLPVYREVNTYKHVLPQSLTGNMERTNLSELHHKAWAVLTKSPDFKPLHVVKITE